MIFEMQAELCHAMGTPLRIEIMHLLRDRHLSVKAIASGTHQSQATISRNLKALRNAGLITPRRQGTNILYSVANPKLTAVCDLMREVLTEQIEHQAQIARTFEDEPDRDA
jgi:DNA-binding transcriptional ArsR family regulator